MVGAAIGLGACRTKPTVVGTTQAQAPSPTVFAPVPAPTVPAPTTPSPAASASPGARLHAAGKVAVDHDGHLELISFQHWANDYGLDVFGDDAPIRSTASAAAISKRPRTRGLPRSLRVCYRREFLAAVGRNI